MKREDPCVQNRNRARGRASEGQPNGLGQPGLQHLDDSRVGNETKFVR